MDYSPIKLSCIVEGKGEVDSLPILVKRVAQRLEGTRFILVDPIRVKRDKFLADPHYASNQLQIASLKIRDTNGAILVLLDAEEDCPVELLSHVRERCQEVIGHESTYIVFATRMYENWFVAAAESISSSALFADSLEAPEEVEERSGKNWIKQHVRAGAKYSETIDQKELTTLMKLEVIESKSRSFRKFVSTIREILDEFGALGSQSNE